MKTLRKNKLNTRKVKLYIDEEFMLGSVVASHLRVIIFDTIPEEEKVKAKNV